METFIKEWWPVLIPALLALSKLANTVTKHWPQWKPYLRWLGFLVEITDLVRIPEIKKKGCNCEAGKTTSKQ